MSIPRILPLVFLAALVSLTTASPGYGHHCPRRYLHGLNVDDFPTAGLFEGMYVKVVVDGQVVYIHESKDMMGFVSSDESWGIYSHKEFQVKLKRNESSGFCEYFDPIEGRFIPTDDVKFRCAPDTMHQCPTDEFMFKARHFAVPESVADEIFTLSKSSMHDNLPVYRSQNGLFLFHSHSGWQVADDLNSAPFLYAASHASSPAFISAKWKVLVNNEWGTSHGLHLACQSHLKSKNCNDDEPCLHNSTCHISDHGKYCLCAPGFTDDTCSTTLPVCPAIPKIEDTTDTYPTLTSQHYVGDTVTLKCREGMAKDFVRISCHRNSQGEASWSDDVTCNNDPPAKRALDNPDQQALNGPVVSDASSTTPNAVITAVCAVLGVLLFAAIIVLIVVLGRKYHVGQRYSKTQLRVPLSRQESVEVELQNVQLSAA